MNNLHVELIKVKSPCHGQHINDTENMVCTSEVDLVTDTFSHSASSFLQF